MFSCAFSMNVAQECVSGLGFSSTSIQLVSRSRERKYNSDSDTHANHEKSSQFLPLVLVLCFLLYALPFLVDDFLSKMWIKVE